MTPVLLDSGCIVALLDRSERRHEECVEAIDALSDPIITCEAVIAESTYLLRDCRGAARAILENVERGLFQIPFRLAGNAKAVSDLMEKYSGAPMDLADACLVQMAKEHRTSRILTLDRDFQVYRWGRNRPFDLLMTL